MVDGEEYTYEEAEEWPWKIYAVPGIACDSQDRVYIVRRTHQPAVLVFDSEGNFLTSWGEDIFEAPHGIWISPDDYMYVTDTKDHTVRKLSLEGEVLMTLGTKGKPGKPGEPFNRPTRAVESPSGEIYVSDGYGQQRVHKFAPDGTLLLSWGSVGNGLGQFNLPHSIWVDRQERVYVPDRPNNRIEIFTSEGKFVEQWTNLISPNEIFIDANNIVYVTCSTAEGVPGVSILTLEGKVLTHFQCRSPHGIWVDSKGAIYVAELILGTQKFVRKTP